MTEKDASAIMGALLLSGMLGTKEKKDLETPEIDGDKIRKQSEDLGNSYYHVYLGYKDAGFNDEQAFKLLLETVRRN